MCEIQKLQRKLETLTVTRNEVQAKLTAAWNARIAAGVGEYDEHHPMVKVWKSLDQRDTRLMVEISEIREELEDLELED